MLVQYFALGIHFIMFKFLFVFMEVFSQATFIDIEFIHALSTGA
jgi:hypothetical protein